MNKDVDSIETQNLIFLMDFLGGDSKKYEKLKKQFFL